MGVAWASGVGAGLEGDDAEVTTSTKERPASGLQGMHRSPRRSPQGENQTRPDEEEVEGVMA